MSHHPADDKSAYHIGLHRIDDASNQIVHTILLRIDCTEEEILSSCSECITTQLGDTDIQFIPASLKKYCHLSLTRININI